MYVGKIETTLFKDVKNGECFSFSNDYTRIFMKIDGRYTALNYVDLETGETYQARDDEKVITRDCIVEIRTWEF